MDEKETVIQRVRTNAGSTTMESNLPHDIWNSESEEVLARFEALKESLAYHGISPIYISTVFRDSKKVEFVARGPEGFYMRFWIQNDNPNVQWYLDQAEHNCPTQIIFLGIPGDKPVTNPLRGGDSGKESNTVEFA